MRTMLLGLLSFRNENAKFILNQAKTFDISWLKGHLLE